VRARFIASVVREAGYRFRACFRARWGGYVALVMLIGVVGGVAMAAVAGGRRTQSSFPAYLVQARVDPAEQHVQRLTSRGQHVRDRTVPRRVHVQLHVLNSRQVRVLPAYEDT
jgi:hypothetical protein